jgi:hypothetical protein
LECIDHITGIWRFTVSMVLEKRLKGPTCLTF